METVTRPALVQEPFLGYRRVDFPTAWDASLSDSRWEGEKNP